ncbi:MAG: TonB-dependent receptor [Brachymonas sp.]|nr:TonB-dependent receptor [Brachymonas sp.]
MKIQATQRKLVGKCVLAAAAFWPLGGWSQTAPAAASKADAEINELPITSVTATRTHTPAELLPVTAHSVTQQEIEDQPVQQRNNYGELLMGVPGVYVAPQVPTVAPWVNLRGTGYFIARTLYLVDGLPVTSSHIPMLTNTVAPADIARLDVVLGPSSALYGASASGGAFNIVTRDGRSFQGKQAALAYGSFNTMRASATIGNKSDTFDYYFSLTHDQSKGYKTKPLENMLELYRLGKTSFLSGASIEDEWSRNLRFAGSVGIKLGNGRLSLSHHRSHYTVSSGQPNRMGAEDAKQSLSKLQYQFKPASNLTFTGTLGYQDLDRPITTNGGLKLVAGKALLNPKPVSTTYSRMTRRLAEIQTDYSPEKNHIITGGVSFHRELLSSQRVSATTGATLRSSRTHTDEKAAFLQYQGFFMNERLSVILGSRYDKWRFFNVFNSTSKPHPPKNSLSRSTVTYRAATKFKINDQYALRSSIGTAFWPGDASWMFSSSSSGNSWSEANPKLKPEKTWMIDAGLESNHPKSGLHLNITPYYGRIKNMLSYRYDQHPTLPNVTIRRTDNLAQARIYGLEVNGKWQINPKLSLASSLTLNRSRITAGSANVGNQIRNAPDRIFNLGVRYIDPSLFNTSVNLRTVSQRYADDENTQLPYYKMRPYESLDAKIWKSWNLAGGNKLTASLSAVNLLNKKYETQLSSMHPGRTWMATISINGL